MIKYASNALLATLISFSNEIATFCENIPGTDVEVVMHGVHLDRRLSPVINGERISPEIIAFLRGGCGFGGACLPKDVNALRAYARELGIVPHVLDAVIAVNASRPGQLVTLAEQVLGSVRDAIIAVLGVAFKPGTSDVRESPAVKVIDLLLSKGATVKAYDPVAALPVGVFAPDRRVLLCNAPEEAFDGADAALLVTAWPELLKRDWRALCARMRRQVVIDGRNALRHVTWPANITYLSIGRVPGNQQSERSQWR
jgi:UDPglucose 6-dehydrogenase/GDP-mannose 6-dehydrogenase